MVLIKFSTADKKIHEIEINPDSVIGEAKQLYQQQVGGCEAKAIKMIYKKRILSDNVVISTLNIQEKDFIVVYTPKAKTNQQPQISPNQSNSNIIEPTSNQGTETQSISRPNPEQISQPYSSLLQTNPLPFYQSNQNNQPQQFSSLPSFSPYQNNAFNPFNYGQLYRPFRSTDAFNQISQNNQYNLMNDPEFLQKVDQLMEIGQYRRPECEAALRASYGNVERAAEYLLSGNIPTSPNTSTQNNQTHQLNNEFIVTFRKMLQREPRVLENFVEEFERENPIYRQQPELLLSQFGLSTEGFDLEGIRNYSVNRVDTQYFDQLLAIVQNEVECPNLRTCLDQIDPNYDQQRANAIREPQILNQFSDEEKAAIRRLQNLGNFSLNEVVQIYIASDKNEAVAANLLFSNK